MVATKRTISLVVDHVAGARTTISGTDLRLAFEVTLSETELDETRVIVYNIRPDRVYAFLPGDRMTVSVGDPGLERNLISVAPIAEVKNTREALDSRLEILSTDVSLQVSETMYAQKGSYPLRRAVQDLISRADLVIDLDSLENIPADVQITNWSDDGRLEDILAQMLDPYGLKAKISNDVVKIFVLDRTPTRAAGFVVSESSGMLGFPRPTDVGMDVTTILRPEMLPGSYVLVEASGAPRGPYKILKTVHAGDTGPNGEWTTRIECRDAPEASPIL